MRKQLWIVLASFLCLALAQPVMAGSKRVKNEPDTNPDSAVTTLTAVDTASGKVTLTTKDNGQDVTYGTMGCTITVDGAPADINQLHEGMKVLGYTENDSSSLSSLDVSASGGDKPKAPPKKKK